VMHLQIPTPALGTIPLWIPLRPKRGDFRWKSLQARNGSFVFFSAPIASLTAFSNLWIATGVATRH
jgi:hypothetical protein